MMRVLHRKLIAALHSRVAAFRIKAQLYSAAADRLDSTIDFLTRRAALSNRESSGR